MPNRYLRETYITSPRINAVGPDARDCWIRLLLAVDDHGRFWGDPQLIASRCFPLSPNAKACEGMLADLASAQLILRYAVAGKQYVCITQWQDRIRSQSKYPAPPSEQATETMPDGPANDLLSGDAVNGAHSLTVADKCRPHANTGTFSPSPSPSPSAPTKSSPASTAKIAFDAETGWTGISAADRKAWGEAYPAVDVAEQLARAKVWVLSHPKNRKSNWRQFLVGWFGRAQDRAPAGRSGYPTEDGPRKWQ